MKYWYIISGVFTSMNAIQCGIFSSIFIKIKRIQVDNDNEINALIGFGTSRKWLIQ